MSAAQAPVAARPLEGEGASFEVNGRKIGPGHPTYIVAELSCNHNQDKDVAIKLIHEAAKAGSDAIKLQHYTPDTITIDCDKEYFQLNTGTQWDGQTLHSLYGKAYTPWEWTAELKELANYATTLRCCCLKT